MNVESPAESSRKIDGWRSMSPRTCKRTLNPTKLKKIDHSNKSHEKPIRVEVLHLFRCFTHTHRQRPPREKVSPKVMYLPGFSSWCTCRSCRAPYSCLSSIEKTGVVAAFRLRATTIQKGESQKQRAVCSTIDRSAVKPEEKASSSLYLDELPAIKV